MTSIFNRLKSRKAGLNNQENESTSQNYTFDAEGFLCPICHQKFNDHSELAKHYSEIHANNSITDKDERNSIKKHPKDDETLPKSIEEEFILKQQFEISEESRKRITAELMNQKQHCEDLEEERQLLNKHLKLAQAKISEQSQEIANLKATKDVYDAQLTIIHNDLIQTQNELNQKQKQIIDLSSKLSAKTLDMDTNKINEDDEQIRFDHYKSKQHFDKLEEIFNQNLLTYNELNDRYLLPHQSQINQIKDLLKTVRERKQNLETAIKRMRHCFSQSEIELKQACQLNSEISVNIEQQKQINDQIIIDLNEQISCLNNEIDQLKNEKNDFIQSKIDNEISDEKQDFIRRIQQEKEQYEQQTKNLRLEVKQLHNERQQIQNEFNYMSKRNVQISDEKDRLNTEICTIKKQFDEKEQEVIVLKNELKIEKTKSHQLFQQNEQLNSVITERNNIEQQLQIKQKIIDELQSRLSQFHSKLENKETYIRRLLYGIRRSTENASKTRAYLQNTICTSQKSILAIFDQVENDSRLIHEQYRNQLTNAQMLVMENKNKLEKQMEDENRKLIEHIKELNSVKIGYEKIIEEEKENFQIQINQSSKNLLKATDDLYQAQKMHQIQKEAYEQEIENLNKDMQFQNTKHELQLAALSANLATVRSELRASNEKSANVEQIKSEKADVEARLLVSQDERHVLLERSLANETKYETLLTEHNQLLKRNTHLDSALQELAREYQVLQIQTNKLNERRWLDDDDVHACMKCNQTFTLTQRKHHCRNCGNIFCDNCSSKTATIAASSRKAKRVCDKCYETLTS